MKDTYHVEAGTTATSECPIYRNGSWIGYVAPHHAKALAEALRGESPRRTARQIVDQTNELAARLYALRGYIVAPGYRFDEAHHPQEREAWAAARAAQLLLTDTDPDDAIQDLDEE